VNQTPPLWVVVAGALAAGWWFTRRRAAVARAPALPSAAVVLATPFGPAKHVLLTSAECGCVPPSYNAGLNRCDCQYSQIR
jgi:hypothetical protein